MRLLSYASGLSENGGESWCRGCIIQEGFQPPLLQVVFRDPLDTSRVMRADFTWRLGDGRTVVLEYDGLVKFRAKTMTRGRSVEHVVDDERSREKALSRAGVSLVIRTNYKQVGERDTLISSLLEVGIPRRPVAL
ncbi:hypothetical protein CRD60_04380 [Bifidobacterium aemilianum]|uniref:CTP synthase n=1 Tax=Bifidobacterium aemilianum TaxID=2493120 RepID=A0A366KAZ0_9BIFI|nr:hypothetical protein CRD60_04380 [Bifidobacterium aemilianum]